MVFGYQDVHKKDCQTSFHGYFQKGHFFKTEPCLTTLWSKRSQSQRKTRKLLVSRRIMMLLVVQTSGERGGAILHGESSRYCLLKVLSVITNRQFLCVINSQTENLNHYVSYEFNYNVQSVFKLSLKINGFSIFLISFFIIFTSFHVNNQCSLMFCFFSPVQCIGWVQRKKEWKQNF